MPLQTLVDAIDAEMDRLARARAILVDEPSAETLAQTPKKRNLTPEGRARIAEAVTRRWAAKKAAKKAEKKVAKKVQQ